MYIQIGNTKYECKATTFTTQSGKEAVRVVSDAPVATNGFLLLNSKEELIADRSDFTHLYREDGNVKEYTATIDTIVEAEGYNSPVPKNPITQALSNLNNRVTDITPYKQSKKGYYGDKEKNFYGVPNGVVSVFFENYDGEYTVRRNNDVLTVAFPVLEKETNITIMVQ